MVQTMNPEEKKKYVKNEPASVPRKKAKLMEESRDAWKEKNQEKLNSIKALKARLNETKESRKDWKLEYLKQTNETDIYKEKAQTLENELIKERFEKEYLLTEIETLKKKLHCGSMS